MVKSPVHSKPPTATLLAKWSPSIKVSPQVRGACAFAPARRAYAGDRSVAGRVWFVAGNDRISFVARTLGSHFERHVCEQDVQRCHQHRRSGLGPRLGAVSAASGASGVAQCPLHRPRRRRLLRHGALGRTDRDPEHQPPGAERSHLHQLAHHRPLLADSVVTAHRAQPHHQRDGLHRRGDHRVPQRQRPHPVRVRHHRRGPRGPGMEHLHARQVAPGGGRRDEHGLDQAELAGGPRIRALLRVPRRRDQPVVPGPRSTTTTRSISHRFPRTAITSPST